MRIRGNRLGGRGEGQAVKSNSIKARRKQKDTLTGFFIGFGTGMVAAGLFLIVVLVYCRMAGPL